MTPETSPSPYLIDPGQGTEDDRSRALIALDGHIREDPGLASEVVVTSLIEDSTPQYSPDTPHAHTAAAIDEALAHTNNGVALFNRADENSFNKIINNPVYQKRVESRRKNPDSDELARRAALAGLRIYIDTHTQIQ